MLWQSGARGTQTSFWFGHGCSGERMLSKHERYYGLGMDALVSVDSGNTNVYYGLGMDALVSVGSRNTNVIMVWAWMLWISDAVVHGQTRCVVYAVFRALKTPRMCGSSHAGHIRRGRPSMHCLRVYALWGPITTRRIIIRNTNNSRGSRNSSSRRRNRAATGKEI